MGVDRSGTEEAERSYSGGFCGSSDVLKGTPLSLSLHSCSIQSCLSCSLTSREKKSRLERALERRREEGAKELIAEEVLREEEAAAREKEGLLQRRRKGPRKLKIGYEEKGKVDTSLDASKVVERNDNATEKRVVVPARDLSLEPLTAKDLVSVGERGNPSTLPITAPAYVPTSSASSGITPPFSEAGTDAKSEESSGTTTIVYTCPLVDDCKKHGRPSNCTIGGSSCGGNGEGTRGSDSDKSRLEAGKKEVARESAADRGRQGNGREAAEKEGDDDVLIRVYLENGTVLGDVDVDKSTTLEQLRELIEEELDEVPSSFVFIAKGAPVGRKQEKKRRAMSYLPSITLRSLGLGSSASAPSGLSGIQSPEQSDRGGQRPAGRASEHEPLNARDQARENGGPLPLERGASTADMGLQDSKESETKTGADPIKRSPFFEVFKNYRKTSQPAPQTSFLSSEDPSLSVGSADHPPSSEHSVSHSQHSDSSGNALEEKVSTLRLPSIGGESEKVLRWKKGMLLGRGAFADVFLGINSDTGEFLAVKQLRQPIQISATSSSSSNGSLPLSSLSTQASSSKEAVEIALLEKEIGLLRTLSHPLLVRYYGFTIEGGRLHIILEYVSGGSIAKNLETFGAFNENHIRRYTAQILEGLDYLHKNGVLHRDIKGANILVENSGRVKLSDFGASKIVQNLTSTTASASAGTIPWMSPEVVRGETVDRKADIWSLGCTVVEMLTARVPWSFSASKDDESSRGSDSGWPYSLLYKIGVSTTGPPLPPNVSEELKDFLEQCFQRDPKDRPTAEELLSHPFITQDPLPRKTERLRWHDQKNSDSSDDLRFSSDNSPPAPNVGSKDSVKQEED